MDRLRIIPDRLATALAQPRILIGSAGIGAVLLAQLVALLLTHVPA